jgi:hypothetical protein
MLSKFLLTKATWQDTVFIMGNPCAYEPSFPTVLTMIDVIIWLTMIRSFNQSIFISNPLLTSSLITVHQMITSTTVDGGGLGRIVSLKLKRKFLPSNYILLNLDVVKISLDKGDLTWYYIHNGKSLRLQTLFSNALNYDWFIQSIFISNPLLTSSLITVHQMITSTTVDGDAWGRIVSLKLKRKFWPSN